MSNPSCRCCGRPLTDKASQLKGIGPDCERNPACKRDIPIPDDQFHDMPWDEETRNVIYERRIHLEAPQFIPVSAFGDLPTTTTKHFNIPRRHVDHSPSGWEWGYGGSGPADFALNILAHFEDAFPRHRASAGTTTLFDGSRVHRDVYDLHQAFKRDFLEAVPQASGGVILGKSIVFWIERHAPQGMTTEVADGDTDSATGKVAERQAQAGLFDLGNESGK